jgi:hypothetical protein
MSACGTPCPFNDVGSGDLQAAASLLAGFWKLVSGLLLVGRDTRPDGAP